MLIYDYVISQPVTTTRYGRDRQLLCLRYPEAGGNTEKSPADFKRMWRRLRNFLYSFRTYADLSPDLRTRQRVKRFLSHRPALSADAWFEQLWQPRGIAKPVADFVYARMPTYSGLDFARVRPDDCLNDDLHLPLICWFDWQLSFREDFLQWFGIDLSDRFDPEDYTTVAALMAFLNHQLLSVNHS